MYTMLLSPLGLFHEFFCFDFIFPMPNIRAHNPAGTTSANHADLLSVLPCFVHFRRLVSFHFFSKILQTATIKVALSYLCHPWDTLQKFGNPQNWQ
jgi:hypothetical protein